MNNATLDVLGGIVDRLAEVKAQIAQLRDEEDNLKQVLVESDQTVIEGTEHRAALSWVCGSLVTDWKAVAEQLAPSRQLVRAHSRMGADRVCVRISARKTS
jgi:hypothetical protein